MSADSAKMSVGVHRLSVGTWARSSVGAAPRTRVQAASRGVHARLGPVARSVGYSWDL